MYFGMEWNKINLDKHSLYPLGSSHVNKTLTDGRAYKYMNILITDQICVNNTNSTGLGIYLICIKIFTFHGICTCIV